MTHRNKSYDRNMSRREDPIVEDDESDLVKPKLDNLSNFQLNFKHHTVIVKPGEHSKKGRSSTHIDRAQLNDTHKPKEILLDDDQVPTPKSWQSSNSSMEVESEIFDDEVDVRACFLARNKNSFFNEKIKNFNEKKSQNHTLKRMRLRGAEFAIIKIDKQPSIPTMGRDMTSSESLRDRMGSNQTSEKQQYHSQASLLSNYSKSLQSVSRLSGKVHSDSMNNHHLYSVEFRPSMNPPSSQFPSSQQNHSSTPEHSSKTRPIPTSDVSLSIHPNTTKQVSLLQNRVSKDAELLGNQPDCDDHLFKRDHSEGPSISLILHPETPSRRLFSNPFQVPIHMSSSNLLPQRQHQNNESNYTIDIPISELQSIKSTPVRKLEHLLDDELLGQLVDLIYHKRIGELKDLLLVMQREYRTDILNHQDGHGNTPFMLAIKLSYISQEYFEMARLLLIHGSDPAIKDDSNWAPIEETVAQMDIQSTSLIFDYLIRYKQIEFQRTRYSVDQELSTIDDFYLEIKWEFTSSIIPFFSKMAPSDVFKLHKHGTSMRLDQTFAGLKNFKAKRRDITLIYNPRERGQQRKENQRDCQYIVMLNRSKHHYFYPLQEIDPEEKRQIIFDLLNCDNVSGQLKFWECKLQRSRNIFGNQIDTQIGDWPAQKYDFKVKTEQQFQRKNHKPLLLTYDQYVAQKRQKSLVKQSISPSRCSEKNSRDILHQLSQQVFKDPSTKSALRDSVVESSRGTPKQVSKNCTVYIANGFPLRIQQFMPILKLLAQGNHLMQSLEQLLQAKEIQTLLVDEGFPVRVEIPVSFSIEAVVTFQNYRKLDDDFNNEQLFEISPDIRYMHRKQAQKTMLREKKRLLLANLFLS